MTTHTTERVKKSEKLTTKEHAKFKIWLEKQATATDAAEISHVDRVTLTRIGTTGSGSPENIAKIRAVIAQKATGSKLIETASKKSN